MKRLCLKREAWQKGNLPCSSLVSSESNWTFENVHGLDREDRWFERGIKEAFYVKLEQPSFNCGGHSLSAIYDALLKSPHQET